MRVALPFRAGGAAASAQTVQAERAAELACRARFMPGWRAQRRREGLKPAGPGQPAGPVRSTKARRRSRHAKVSPGDTARNSQSAQDGEKSAAAAWWKGMRSVRTARPTDCLRSHGKSQSLQHGDHMRRLLRVRSSAAERRGVRDAPGPARGLLRFTGTGAAGRAPPAGWPALWRACGVAPGGGLEQQRPTKARSRERSSARGVGRAGRSWRRGAVGAGVALACGLQRKPHDSAVGGRIDIRPERLPKVPQVSARGCMMRSE